MTQKWVSHFSFNLDFPTSCGPQPIFSLLIFNSFKNYNETAVRLGPLCDHKVTPHFSARFPSLFLRSLFLLLKTSTFFLLYPLLERFICRIRNTANRSFSRLRIKFKIKRRKETKERDKRIIAIFNLEHVVEKNRDRSSGWICSHVYCKKFCFQYATVVKKFFFVVIASYF